MQVLLGQKVHIVAAIGLQKVMCQHGIEECAFYLYAVVGQDSEVVFKVLSYFGNFLIGKKRLEFLPKEQRSLSLRRKGNIISLLRVVGQGQTHYFGLQRFQRGGFGIEAEDLLL